MDKYLNTVQKIGIKNCHEEKRVEWVKWEAKLGGWRSTERCLNVSISPPRTQGLGHQNGAVGWVSLEPRWHLPESWLQRMKQRGMIKRWCPETKPKPEEVRLSTQWLERDAWKGVTMATGPRADGPSQRQPSEVFKQVLKPGLLAFNLDFMAYSLRNPETVTSTSCFTISSCLKYHWLSWYPPRTPYHPRSRLYNWVSVGKVLWIVPGTL